MGCSSGLMGGAFTLLDTLVMKVIDKKEYGGIRLWAALGWALAAFSMGFIYQYFLDLKYMFVVFLICMAGNIPIWLFCAPSSKSNSEKPKIEGVDEKLLDEEAKEDDSEIGRYEHSDANISEEDRQAAAEMKQKQKEVQNQPYFKRLKMFLGSLEASSIQAMIVVIPMGAAYGLINALLFVYLKSLGASEILLGTSILLNVVTEVPCFVFSQTLRDKYGVRSILYIGMAAYAIRCGWYAWISNPWAVVPAELLHGVTFALVWSSLAVLATELAPTDGGLQATAQGLFSLLFNGLGAGLGGIGGGYLYEIIGPRYVFAITGGINILGIVFLGICDLLRRWKEKRETLMEPVASDSMPIAEGGIN
eukprot:CAMPEP_0167749390 /NCGR_PEP_ID=MMETSP0110_2-20121227/5379_1 /TAXON_ID=629695 /ORGANISM="Gymnochlora sp., Strain CCMP2014" /LENGTH=362 /DNA_ID=CAMNT_0007634535 /DNA_START=282 /DNA_END=1370 /DNA_ORIENTATION=+